MSQSFSFSQGIGYEIVKKLVRNPNLHAVLACRNEELGRKAIEQLHGEGFRNCEFRQLDISDVASIEQFSNEIKRDFHNSVDILINNAAIAFKNDDPTPFPQQARPTITTNYFGTYELTKRFLPLLRNAKSYGRLVNVASEAGHLRIIKHLPLKQQFANIEELAIPTLNALMNKFISNVENLQHEQQGWPSTCYGMSKLAVVALTKRLALEESAVTAPERKPVLITCCCPGYCATDMSSHKGPKSAEDGATTPVYLATLPNYEAGFNGKFFSDNKEITW